VGSRTEGLRKNDGGSITIMVGPNAPPKGWEANYVRTLPGRAWFPYFRFYGPKKAYFDQSWKLPQIEEVDYKKYTGNKNRRI